MKESGSGLMADESTPDCGSRNTSSPFPLSPAWKIDSYDLNTTDGDRDVDDEEEGSLEDDEEGERREEEVDDEEEEEGREKEGEGMDPSALMDLRRELTVITFLLSMKVSLRDAPMMSILLHSCTILSLCASIVFSFLSFSPLNFLIWPCFPSFSVSFPISTFCILILILPDCCSMKIKKERMKERSRKGTNLKDSTFLFPEVEGDGIRGRNDRGKVTGRERRLKRRDTVTKTGDLFITEMEGLLDAAVAVGGLGERVDFVAHLLETKLEGLVLVEKFLAPDVELPL